MVLDAPPLAESPQAMTKPFRLHTTDLSPFGQRAKLALRVKHLLGETEIVDTFGGTDALGELAPMRQIPILEHAGLRLPESQTIADHLDDLHPDPPLLPDTSNERAHARLLARIADLYIAPHFLTLIVGMRPPPRPEDMQAAFGRLHRGLSFAEPYLSGGTPYAIGHTITMADLALAPFLFYVPRLAEWHGAEPFPAAPNCASYLEAASTDPHIAQAFAEMESAYKARIDSLKSQDSQ